jgi:hypothetical protein
VTFIGIAEPTGDLGVILPMATRFAPVLTTPTAVGLATIMLLAIGFHVRRKEPLAAHAIVFTNAVCGAWTLFSLDVSKEPDTAVPGLCLNHVRALSEARFQEKNVRRHGGPARVR